MCICVWVCVHVHTYICIYISLECQIPINRSLKSSRSKISKTKLDNICQSHIRVELKIRETENSKQVAIRCKWSKSMTQRHEIESGARGLFKVLKGRIVITFDGPVSIWRNFFISRFIGFASFRFSRVKWYLYSRISFFELLRSAF